ncbi:conserved hypothetical protein [Candidatus Sulfopaludibacter sp. SbA4]|nr:conserved hypothetical protein [Candidatus Sulfopaludibacter sp. SbA4]
MLTGQDLAGILAAAGAATQDDLTEFVYWNCYVRDFSEAAHEPAERATQAWRPVLREDLTPLLRAAHAGNPCREFGWRVEQVLEAGRVVARKGGDVRRFEPGHYLNLDSPFSTGKDQRIAICLPKDSTTLQAGYYHIFGEAIGEDDESPRILRFYWNITAEGAPLLVGLITRALGRFQIPYQMKLPHARTAYFRRDAAVVYLNRRYYRVAAMILAGVHREIAAHLADDTPLYTKRLARGLAMAENPGESFGKTRSRMVAQALWKARELGLTGETGLLAALDREFRECGIDPDRPYLNPGSRDEYGWP